MPCNESRNGFTYKKIIAKPQIFKSSPDDAHFLKLNGSTFASSRSLLILLMMYAHSFSDRNFQAVLCALSGKSTSRKYPPAPRTQVRMPSIMKILVGSVKALSPVDLGNRHIQLETGWCLPSPSSVTSYAVHLHQSVGQDASTSRRKTSN